MKPHSSGLTYICPYLLTSIHFCSPLLISTYIKMIKHKPTFSHTYATLLICTKPHSSRISTHIYLLITAHINSYLITSTHIYMLTSTHICSHQLISAHINSYLLTTSHIYLDQAALISSYLPTFSYIYSHLVTSARIFNC